MYNPGDFVQVRQLALFKEIDDEGLKKVLDMVFVKDYPASTVLFNEGMDGDVMYVVINGEVQLSRKNENKENILLATIKDGSFFGEMSLVENDKRTAAAKITLNTKMLVITRRTFQQMVETIPQVSSKLLLVFLKVMSNRLRMANKR